MDRRGDETKAKERWIMLQLMRLGGIAMMLVGLLVVNRVIEWSEIVGYVLIVFGIVEVFVMPTVFTRLWASPRTPRRHPADRDRR